MHPKTCSPDSIQTSPKCEYKDCKNYPFSNASSRVIFVDLKPTVLANLTLLLYIHSDSYYPDCVAAARVYLASKAGSMYNQLVMNVNQS